MMLKSSSLIVFLMTSKCVQLSSASTPGVERMLSSAVTTWD